MLPVRSITTFGHQLYSSNCSSVNEWSSSCRIIESSFSSYREQLATFMIELAAISERMTLIDKARVIENKPSLSRIHQSYKDMMKEIPRLWDYNEIILRELVT